MTVKNSKMAEQTNIPISALLYGRLSKSPSNKPCAGNGRKFESLVPLFKGHDLVISVLGFPKQIDDAMTKFTESMDSILKAMRLSQVQRIVTISAWYTNPCTRKGK